MKIICIWKNYGVARKDFNPEFYYKPETSLLQNNKPFYIPEYSNKILFSPELVVKINKAGKYIDKKFAETYYNAVAVGLNMHATDIQENLIKNKLPLDKSYSFDGSSPISIFFERSTFNSSFTFQVYSEAKIIFEYNADKMIYSIDRIISSISEYIMLKTGDIIFTGPISKPFKIIAGKRIECYLNGKNILKTEIR